MRITARLRFPSQSLGNVVYALNTRLLLSENVFWAFYCMYRFLLSVLQSWVVTSNPPSSPITSCVTFANIYSQQPSISASYLTHVAPISLSLSLSLSLRIYLITCVCLSLTDSISHSLSLSVFLFHSPQELFVLSDWISPSFQHTTSNLLSLRGSDVSELNDICTGTMHTSGFCSVDTGTLYASSRRFDWSCWGVAVCIPTSTGGSARGFARSTQLAVSNRLRSLWLYGYVVCPHNPTISISFRFKLHNYIEM